MERRFYPGQTLRMFSRDAPQAPRSVPTLAGLACPYDSWIVISQDDEVLIRECVRAGAFDKSLRGDDGDIIATFNHNPNFILGSRRAGTLKLTPTSGGLHSRIHPPDTAQARELITLIERGDVRGQSFMFDVRGPSGIRRRESTAPDGRKLIERELVDLVLFELGPVSLPAYRATTIAVQYTTTTPASARDRIARIDAKLSRVQTLARLDSLLAR